jgi:NTP pyrophosphatase (non-canonical NTP hydrolase)
MMDTNLYEKTNKLASALFTILDGAETRVKVGVAWVTPTEHMRATHGLPQGLPPDGGFHATTLHGVEGYGRTPEDALRALQTEIYMLATKHMDGAMEDAKKIADALGLVTPQAAGKDFAVPALRQFALMLNVTPGAYTNSQLTAVLEREVRDLHVRFASLTERAEKAEGRLKEALSERDTALKERDGGDEIRKLRALNDEMRQRVTKAQDDATRERAILDSIRISIAAVFRALNIREEPHRSPAEFAGQVASAVARIGQLQIDPQRPARTTGWGGAEQTNKVVTAAKALFDNRLGEAVGQPYAPREFWTALGTYLYGESDPCVVRLRQVEAAAEKAQIDRVFALAENQKIYTALANAMVILRMDLPALWNQKTATCALEGVEDRLRCIRGQVQAALRDRNLHREGDTQKPLAALTGRLAQASDADTRLESIKAGLTNALGLTPNSAVGVDLIATARYLFDSRWDAYQEATKRTMDPSMPAREQMLMTALGLAGEAGEAAEVIKKHVFHGKPLDRVVLQKELGDVLWYMARLAAACAIPLASVPRENLRKLAERYPNGFVRADQPVNGVGMILTLNGERFPAIDFLKDYR